MTVRDITPLSADAGSSRIVNEHQTIIMDGSSSTDNVNVTNWTWTFTYEGATVTIHGPNPEFTFHIAGEYNVTLNVSDASGLWDVDHITIHVLDITNPVAITPDNLIVDQHEEVTLDGTGSTDNVAIVNWTWNFMYDGTPMTLYGEVVQFTFDDAGRYEVSLGVSDAAENRDVAVFEVMVVDITPPTAEAGEDQEVDPGTSVYFDATASLDHVWISSFTWTFVYQGQDIELEGPEPTYYFEAAGTYLVTLTVVDLEGYEGADTMDVTVTDLLPPVAEAGDDLTIDQGGKVTFDGSGSSDNLGITGWVWSLVYDDGPVGSEEERWEWTFDDAGEYVVTLRVEDLAGFHAEDTRVITVSDTTPPVAVQLEDRVADQGDTVELDGSSSTDNVVVTGWTWTFTYVGEERTLSGEKVEFEFSEPGDYVITLIVEDGAGHTDERSFNLHVRDTVAPTPPKLDDIEAGKGDEVSLDGVGAYDNVDVVGWTWTFEEGGETIILEGMQVEYVFEEAGDYKVTLTVVDTEGNEAAETFTVTVSGGTWIWAVVAVVVVAVVVMALMIARRSRA